MNDFKIKIKGLKNGKHSFLFKIKDSFFKNLNNSEIQHADVNAKFDLHKNKHSLKLLAKIEGKINRIPCDICTEEISIDIVNQAEIIIKEGEDELNSTDEIIYVSSSKNELSVKQIIFELIILSMPQKRQHKKDKNGVLMCNSEMLKLIEEYKSTKKKNVDERWSALKNLKTI